MTYNDTGSNSIQIINQSRRICVDKENLTRSVHLTSLWPQIYTVRLCGEDAVKNVTVPADRTRPVQEGART